MTADSPHEPSGDVIAADSSEELYRQVSPDWWDGSRLTSQTFFPTEKDDGLVSVAASTLTDPQSAVAAFRRHGYESTGVAIITVTEAGAKDLPVQYDPLEENHEMGPDEAHAVINFRRIEGNTRRKKKARLLARLARYSPHD